KLPMTIPRNSEPAVLTDKQILRNLAKSVLTSLGLSEFQTYSFVSPKTVDRVRVPQDSWKRNFIKLINPLGEDTSVMRTTLLPNMLDCLKTNYSRNNEAVRAFELGNTFINNGRGGDGLPEERDSLCIGCYGKGESFFTLKGVIEELLRVLGIKNVEFVAESGNASYHPGRCARVLKDGNELAVFGQLHPDIADSYDLGCEVYAAELDFEELFELSDTERKYKPLPKFPALTRDFAMVVEEKVQVGELEKLIAETAGELLESVKLFDVYRGAPVPPGYKSAAFSLVYRAKDRTLTDTEVNAINETVLAGLKDKYNAVLREM
ncbi:MAG: phenylalanine--tRNA ligase subunit beta, partial [Firmicutes bacterium]|nr:phenylalanine--tRNA ligase subunit beta [Bacillota bacterium]